MVRRVIPSVRSRRPRWSARRLVVGPLAAAALLLAACGSDDAGGATSTTVVAAAADQAGSAGATEPAPPTAEGKVAAADSMMVFQPAEYVYEGDMPVLDGPAGAWRWLPGRTPSPEQIAAAAAVFGVAGDVIAQPADMGGGWAVGTEGSPRLTVSEDAQGSWSFMGETTPLCMDDVAVASEPSTGAAEPTDAASPVTPDAQAADSAPADPSTVSPPDTAVPPDTVACVEPVGIPTADEARVAATELLQSLGLDPNAYAITADSQAWGAWVDARLLLDGIATPVVTSFGFGAEGALTFAAGQLLAPESAGPFERTGTAAALEQLREDQFRSYSPAGDPAATDMVPLPATEPVDPDTPASAPAEDTPSVDAGDATEAQAPEGTTTPSEPVKVVLTGVEAGWWMVWADDGMVWLLPGYDFITDHDERISAPAVAQLDMPVVETMTGTVEPQPGAGEAPAEPDIAPPLND
jgi:hypothetical protein